MGIEPELSAALSTGYKTGEGTYLQPVVHHQGPSSNKMGHHNKSYETSRDQRTNAQRGSIPQTISWTNSKRKLRDTLLTVMEMLK